MVNQLYKMRDQEYMEGLMDLINYLKEGGNTKDMTMVEIGSYAGQSTELFSKHFKNVIAIDPFINDYDPNDITCEFMPLESVFVKFTELINKLDNVSHIRMISDDAIKQLLETQVDFVYIDGLHTYDQVSKDIDNYLKIIKPNGSIGGHDYHTVYQGVINAVTEKLGEPDITFKDTSWIKKLNK
jgi:predicted O-methyltransferase YrrM